MAKNVEFEGNRELTEERTKGLDSIASTFFQGVTWNQLKRDYQKLFENLSVEQKKLSKSEYATLILEDDPAVKMLLELGMKQHKHLEPVVFSSTVTKGQIALKNYDFDIILADVHLEDTDVSAMFSDIPEGTPLVLMTGDPEAAEELRNHPQVTSLVLKPFFPTQIFSLINRILGIDHG